MVMASKKTNINTTSKKPVNNQPAKTSTLFRLLKKWWWAVLLISLLVFGVSFFAYEKYLDRQNVADMKQLLADFEQLKTDVEAETGEKLFIESSCGSVGKFSESYSCVIRLTPISRISNERFTNSVYTNQGSFLIDNGCFLASTGYKLESPTDNYYECSGIHVRPSNKATANRIFY